MKRFKVLFLAMFVMLFVQLTGVTPNYTKCYLIVLTVHPYTLTHKKIEGSRRDCQEPSIEHLVPDVEHLDQQQYS